MPLAGGEQDLAAQLHRARGPTLAAYVAILLLATLTDFGLDEDPGAVSLRLGRALALVPTPRALVDAARNMTLFAGWGMIWVATAPLGAARGPQARRAIGSGVAISAMVEVLQLWSSRRVSSVADVVTDTLGVALGVWGMRWLLRRLSVASGRPAVLGPPLWLFAGAYGAAAALEAAVPLLRAAVLPHGGPRQRLRAVLEALAAAPWQSVAASDLILFAPAGMLGVAALLERGRSRAGAVGLTAAAGALASVVAELAHAPLGLRMGIAPMLWHAAAVAGGALLAAGAGLERRRRLAGPRGARLWTLGYAGLVCLWMWRPYRLEPGWGRVGAKLARDWWVPVAALYGLGSDMYSVVDVGVAFLLFLPLGALLAVHPLAARGSASALWPAVWLALATELGQLVVAGRYVDVTDPMVAAAGAAIGWVAARRAGLDREAPVGSTAPPPVE